MSLPSYLKKFFGRSTDPLSSYNAIGKRAKVGEPCIVGSSGSMKPFLQGGERYIIRDRPFSLLQIGDIVVVYWEGEQLNVCHRLIAFARAGNGELYWTTKGDANPLEDQHKMTKDMYVGVADFSVGGTVA